MPDGVQQWVCVNDLYGFGFADLSPGPAKAFSQIASNHYPERLHTSIFIDPPAFFFRMWRLMQAFVPPQTKRKIRVVPYDLHLGQNSQLRAIM